MPIKSEEAREKHREYCRAYYAKNREALRRKNAAYYAEHRDEILARCKLGSKEHYQANKQSILVATRAYYAETKHLQRDSRRAAAIAWAKANPDRVRVNVAAYRAAKIRRTPIWFGELDDLVIREAFDLSRRRQGDWEVDHIVPLQGELVSGLHVWNNIQVIPASVNRSKNNSWDPEKA